MVLGFELATFFYPTIARHDARFFFHSDREYPRLGQMIVDYENPLKKMMEEFVPHGKVTSHIPIRSGYFITLYSTDAHPGKNVSLYASHSGCNNTPQFPFMILASCFDPFGFTEYFEEKIRYEEIRLPKRLVIFN